MYRAHNACATQLAKVLQQLSELSLTFSVVYNVEVDPALQPSLKSMQTKEDVEQFYI